jgi:excisionase family DNA binding protein
LDISTRKRECAKGLATLDKTLFPSRIVDTRHLNQARLGMNERLRPFRIIRLPYLIRLLEDKKIPFRLVGQHRRVRFDDLLAYQRKDDEERRRVAGELTADAQELGMGY